MDFNNLNINILDIILLISIIISIIIGYARGFLKESFSVFNWLFSSWFAFKYYTDINFISKNIKNSLLGPIDKILGMVFGLLRVLILVLVLVIAGNNTIWTNNTIPSLLSKAYSYPMIIIGITYIEKLLLNEILSFDYKEIDIKKINLKNIIDKNKLLDEPPIKNSEENEGSYTPAEREQMDRLNNIETIDTESSN